MAHQILKLNKVHPTKGYSHAARAGNTLYVAGQIAKDIKGNLVGPADIRAQAHQAYTNLRNVIEEAGGSLKDIVKMTTYLTHPDYVEPWRSVRNEYLSEPMPPNTLVIITSLVEPGFLIEVEAIAELQ